MKAPISLPEFTPEEVAELTTLSRSRTRPQGEVLRAKLLLGRRAGTSVRRLAHDEQTTRPVIQRTLKRANLLGVLAAVRDRPRPGRPRQVDEAARTWVLDLACQKPTACGYAAETWTYAQLGAHVRAHCHAAGHPSLAKVANGQLHVILSKGNLRPHKVSYYLERRDPDFEAKKAQVLCVYQEVAAQLAQPPADRREATVSCDEKPGIQAIQTVGPELPPVPGEHPTTSRDHHYRRLGTLSLLAGIDLHTGHVFPLVRARHRSREFIEFLGRLDAAYPADWTIRLILDNHSAHRSKETLRYLAQQPQRFKLVFTPTHGSWLNLIEVFFSKLTRSLLRHMRVQSKAELAQRLYQGIEEVNRAPVVFRWHYQIEPVTAQPSMARN
jgi:transposase